MNWIDLLKDEQREFIQNDEKIFSCKELIYLSNKPLLKQIEETSIKVSNLKPGYRRDNYFLGLLGETAVKKYINDNLMTDKDKSNNLTPINFDIYENGGDPGYDFLSLVFQNFGIQVKTTKLDTANSNLRELKWYITPKEVRKNKVLVCVAALEHPNINCNTLLIAGFLPVEMILELHKAGDIKFHDKWKKYILKIEHLLYCRGLLAYLNNPNISLDENDCNNPESYRARGSFYFRCRLYEKALYEYNQALSLNRNMYTVYSDRAGCYYMLETDKSDERLSQRVLGKNYQETLQQEVDEHLSSRKPRPLTYNQLFDDLFNEVFYPNLTIDVDLDIFISNELDEIENELDKNYPVSSKEPPRITRRHRHRGNGSNKLYWQAIKDASKAIIICPEYIPSYINRGLAYLDLGVIQWSDRVKLKFFEKAINSYSQALDLSIDVSKDLSAVAYYYRSLVYINCYKTSERENRAYAKAANDDAIKAIKLFEEIEWFGAANTARFQIDINLDF